MKIMGYIFVGLLLVVFGYWIGQTPSTQQQTQAAQQTAAQNDLISVSGKYNQLYNLCEQKYQTAIKGDVPMATRLNGQMDTLLYEINQITGKYNQKPL